MLRLYFLLLQLNLTFGSTILQCAKHARTCHSPATDEMATSIARLAKLMHITDAPLCGERKIFLPHFEAAKMPCCAFRLSTNCFHALSAIFYVAHVLWNVRKYILAYRLREQWTRDNCVDAARLCGTWKIEKLLIWDMRLQWNERYRETTWSRN